MSWEIVYKWKHVNGSRLSQRTSYEGQPYWIFKSYKQYDDLFSIAFSRFSSWRMYNTSRCIKLFVTLLTLFLFYIYFYIIYYMRQCSTNVVMNPVLKIFSPPKRTRTSRRNGSNFNLVKFNMLLWLATWKKSRSFFLRKRVVTFIMTKAFEIKLTDTKQSVMENSEPTMRLGIAANSHRWDCEDISHHEYIFAGKPSLLCWCCWKLRFSMLTHLTELNLKCPVGWQING